MSRSYEADSPSPESSPESSLSPSPSPPMLISRASLISGVSCNWQNFPDTSEKHNIYYDVNPGDVVMIGGFKPIPTDNPGPGLRSIGQAFPPPTNKCYELDSHCRIPRLHRHIYPELAPIYYSTGPGGLTQPEVAAMRLELTAENLARLDNLNADEAEVFDTSTGTESEGLMMNIKSTKATPGRGRAGATFGHQSGQGTQKPPGIEQLYSGENTGSHLVFGLGSPADRGPLEFTREEREMFNDVQDDGRGQPNHCKICNTTHIPPGGLLRKGDHHGPFSRLPAWFPRNNKGKPLESLAELIRELIVLEDIEKNGYPPGKSDPHEVWDMHYHEKGRQWSTKHSRDWGGWWKCRSTDDAPHAERECIHCHRPKTRAQMEEQAMAPPLQVKIQYLRDYIDHHSKAIGRKEQAVASAMMRRDGIPAYFNNPLTDDERMALMNWRPGLQTSATNRPIGPRLVEDAAKITAMRLNADAESEGSLGNPRTPMRSFFMQDSDL
ncbi:hypothetical protein HYFRA_00002678 [Hymenoscyphus fraxineus]|uniref:Uncharacterized protein n=1 Tax=Hymenoscyphus fraxineus TaxID=746836 RepID=A0A9N9L690_9HELO|nr:hypothetical protein HYFRA_00002678 [Hymenoscyphus fraxineus]